MTWLRSISLAWPLMASLFLDDVWLVNVVLWTLHLWQKQFSLMFCGSSLYIFTSVSFLLWVKKYQWLLSLYIYISICVISFSLFLLSTFTIKIFKTGRVKISLKINLKLLNSYNSLNIPSPRLQWFIPWLNWIWLPLKGSA